MSRTAAREGSTRESSTESRKERVDRELIELLNELRVALPGVQILFAFLLTVPFAQGFQRTSAGQRDLFFATLLATAVSTICFIAPVATHRLRFHQSERGWIVESANTLMIVGLAFLAVAIGAAFLLITDVMFDGLRVWLYSLPVWAVILVIWFVRPLVRHAQDKSSGP